MRSIRRSRRGLAEIVGTLMLVVIVVAAATAFSFFVASYQKQLQAEETLTHDRALESLKVIGVSEVSCAGSSTCEAACPACFGELNVTVASLDVNSIALTGLFLDQHPVVNYSVVSPKSTESPCFNASDLGNTTHGVGACTPFSLPAYSTVTFVLNLDEQELCSGPGGAPPCWTPGVFSLGGTVNTVTPSSDLDFEILTGLGNQFTEAFTPPDAVASVSFVSTVSAAVPLFDGLNSYQPSSANNASILWYNWTISTSAVTSDTHTGSGTAGPHNSTEVMEGPNAMDGWANFTVPQGFEASGSVATILAADLAFGGTASGVASGLDVMSQTVNSTTDAVFFTYTYTATNSGNLTVNLAVLQYTPSCSPYSGPVLECDELAPGSSSLVVLEVTNTDGLSGVTSLLFTEPA